MERAELVARFRSLIGTVQAATTELQLSIEAELVLPYRLDSADLQEALDAACRRLGEAMHIISDMGA
jgi:hypothetical protein